MTNAIKINDFGCHYEIVVWNLGGIEGETIKETMLERALSLGRELHNIFLAFCLQRQLVIEAVKSLKINYVRTRT